MTIQNYQFIPRTDSQVIQTPTFLVGGFGREINEEIQGKYRQLSAISQVKYDEGTGLIKGSTPFYAAAVNQVLRENECAARTATPAQVERILRNENLDLSGIYVDTGLVLRTEKNPNSYLAKDLIRQVKERTGRKQKLPRMIPLAGLSLREDSNSGYGLTFDLTDEAEWIYAAILNSESGNFSPEDVDLKKGLPRKLGSGNRKLWTTQTGLSRLFLSWGGGLGAGWGGLDGSFSSGRVVLEAA